MAKFTLGFNRQELITVAGRFGKSEKAAKKASTKTLENYIRRQIVGKGVKLPNFTDQDREDVKLHTQEFGLNDGLKRLTYRAVKISGSKNEYAFLRTVIAENFELFHTKRATSADIEELISRLPQMEETKVGSDLIKISPYFRQLFEDYANELAEREREEQEKLQAELQQEFDTNESSSSNNQRSRKTKSKKKK